MSDTIVRSSMMMRGGREEKRRQENAKQRLHILICHCLCHINTVKQFAVSAAFYLAGLCATNQTVKAGFEFIVHIIACALQLYILLDPSPIIENEKKMFNNLDSRFVKKSIYLLAPAVYWQSRGSNCDHTSFTVCIFQQITIHH